jgi:hypothetical protein
MNPPKEEEARREPEGDDLGNDYADGTAAEEQVGLQYDEAGVLVAGTFAFSAGREQTEEHESGEDEEGSSDDDSSEEDEGLPTRNEDDSGIPLLDDEFMEPEIDGSDAESIESDLDVVESPALEANSSADLPYLFDAPTNQAELTSLLENRSSQDCDTILSRVRALYNTRLAHANKEKLEVFFPSKC